MAGETLSRKGEHVESFQLLPAGHGKFGVKINDELVSEHRHESNAHFFPDLQDLLKAVDDRINF